MINSSKRRHNNLNCMYLKWSFKLHEKKTTDRTKHIDKFPITSGDFNTNLQTINKRSRQKNSKGIEDPKNIADKLEIIYIYKTLQQIITEE